MWAPRLPSVAPVSFLSFENSSPFAVGSALSAAMIRKRSGWWMMSSNPAIGSVPAHPEAAQDETTAVDHRHPQFESTGNEEITDQRQCGDAEANGHEGRAEPDPGDA